MTDETDNQILIFLLNPIIKIHNSYSDKILLKDIETNCVLSTQMFSQKDCSITIRK